MSSLAAAGLLLAGGALLAGAVEVDHPGTLRRLAEQARVGAERLEPKL